MTQLGQHFNQQRRNVLLITADQWRGDCLSAVDHPVVRSPHLDALAAEGVLFERHFANAVPCGPSRACLHTGMYLHNHRSGTNGTPLDRRFTNWALELRRAGYDPALFGYTHTAPDPRYMTPDDPRLGTDEGIPPGITPVVDMATHCGPWRDWLKQFGYRLPDDPAPRMGNAVAEHTTRRCRDHRYIPPITPTRFLVQSAMDYVATHARANPAGRCICPVRAHIRPGWPRNRTTRAIRCARCRRRCVATTSKPSAAPGSRAAAPERNASHTDDHAASDAAGELLRPDGGGDDNMGRLRAPQGARSMGRHADRFHVGPWRADGRPLAIRQSGLLRPVVPHSDDRRDPNGVKQGALQHSPSTWTCADDSSNGWTSRCRGSATAAACSLPARPRRRATGAPRRTGKYDFRDSGFEDAGPDARDVFAERVRGLDTKYVHFADLPPLLFDLRNDPGSWSTCAGRASAAPDGGLFAPFAVVAYATHRQTLSHSARDAADRIDGSQRTWSKGMSDLKGKVAFITGAGSGIGRGIASGSRATVRTSSLPTSTAMAQK
jgi:hypothetical protein